MRRLGSKSRAMLPRRGQVEILVRARGNPTAIPNVIIAGCIIYQIRSTADFMQPPPAQNKKKKNIFQNLNPQLTNSISVQRRSLAGTASVPS
jgi:hypothetical protein